MRYFFIDTNIYFSLFSEGSFSEDLLNLLETQVKSGKFKILLPKQVEDEVYRNRNEEWFIKERQRKESKISKFEEKLNKLELDFGKYKHVSKIKRQIEDEVKKIKIEIRDLEKQFLSKNSKANIKLNRVFKISNKIEENDEILKRAFYRREKGNPPEDGNKLGDKIIWESILSFFEKNVAKSSKAKLIFLSNNSKAWSSQVSEKLEFNLWLHKEFKEKTNGSIKYIDRISDIPDLTDIEKEKLKKGMRWQDVSGLASITSEVSDDILKSEDLERINSSDNSLIDN